MSESNSFNIEVFTPENSDDLDVEAIIDFLYNNLDEYRDDKNSIKNAAQYALSQEPNKGGHVIVSKGEDTISGAVIMNLTHMKGYHPPNYLVYIAVHRRYRGTGLGKALVQKANDVTEGGIALHVESENPARFLYEKLGYKNKYLEYRLPE